MYRSTSLLTTSPRSHFLMFMLPLFALLRKIAEPIYFLSPFFPPMLKRKQWIFRASTPTASSLRFRFHIPGIYSCDLKDIHKKLGHPGITRLVYFVGIKNLLFSVDDVKRVCSYCKICAKIKPRFYIKEEELLIKSTRPW